jgi:hypothetical protein
MMNPGDGWAFQRELLDWWMDNPRTLVLKARQLGVTWVSAGFALWHLLFKPGSKTLIYSTGEAQAQEVMKRIWVLYLSLPDALKKHATLTKQRSNLPTEQIIVQHSPTDFSSIRVMSSTVSSGHGETAALVILDEFAYNENAAGIWKATQPTMSHGGRTVIISTANGKSGGYDGANFFYKLWVDAEDRKIQRKFFGWAARPDRSQAWYEANVRGVYDRGQIAESYPATAEEAFQGTGKTFFDADALAFYLNKIKDPLYRFSFHTSDTNTEAVVRKAEDGLIRLYEEPQEDHDYVLSVDPASGGGGKMDSSAVYVLDLYTLAICAEIHSSTIATDELAEQIHFLGKKFNNAEIIPERTGGWGHVIITLLRKPNNGRPPYTKIYRHRDTIRPDEKQESRYGFPTSGGTRKQLVNSMEVVVREQQFPWVTQDLYQEMLDFGEHYSQRTGHKIEPSPCAGPGNKDDTVMACALACYLYQQKGQAPKMHRSKDRMRRFRGSIQDRPRKAKRITPRS